MVPSRRCNGKIPVASFVCAFALVSSALAGPDWDEGPTDAGSTASTAQVITVTSAVNTITGKLTASALVQGDFQDCFLINIETPSQFSITTGPGIGGNPAFNPMLFLFRVDASPTATLAHGVMANNDISFGSTVAGLRQLTNDGSGGGVFGPGVYMIAICGFGSQPINANGQNIFNQAFLQAGVIAGTAAGLEDTRLAGWSADGDVGNYVLNVQGVTGIPAPGALALLALGGLASRRRTR